MNAYSKEAGERVVEVVVGSESGRSSTVSDVARLSALVVHILHLLPPISRYLASWSHIFEAIIYGDDVINVHTLKKFAGQVVPFY